MGILMDYTRKVLLPNAATTAADGLIGSDIYGMGSALVFNFCPGGPVEVVRMGVISQTVTFVATGTSLFEIRVDQHVRTSATGYTVTTAVSNLQTTSSAVMGQPGNGIYVNMSASPISMKAGEKLTFDLSANGAATAGASGTLWIEYRDMPWQGVGRPTTAPGDGTAVGDTANMTNVTL